MQYSALKSLVAVSSTGADETVTIPFQLFRSLLITALKTKNMFDETYYLANNSDIRAAIKEKQIASAADHYYETGYFEGRLPCKLLIDERFYIENNSDVANAVRRGDVKNPQTHFEFTGFKEGRAPYKDFSLF